MFLAAHIPEIAAGITTSVCGYLWLAKHFSERGQSHRGRWTLKALLLTLAALSAGQAVAVLSMMLSGSIQPH